jgi:hypothetical protein
MAWQNSLVVNKLTSVFFAINRPNIIGSDDGTSVVDFDEFISESHSVEAQVTSYPIETGEQIADHIIDMPRELTIRAISTTTPIQLGGGLENVGNIVSNIGNMFKDESDILKPSGRAWHNLIAMMRQKVPISITTILGHYSSMVLVGLNTVSDEDTGEDLFVDMEFKEIFYLTEDGVSSNISKIEEPGLFDAFTDKSEGHKDLLEF